ncbi:MAG TPA: hypothetical protein VKX17_11535 [Planctomycetota bacterium]|nr:hypothetical protein [Planctomycetota bacterium]
MYLTTGRRAVLSCIGAMALGILCVAAGLASRAGGTSAADSAQAAERAAAGPTATLSSKTAVPFQYVKISGSFVTTGTTTVTFTFGKVVLSVTPTEVTASSIRVAAPPLLKGSVFSGGGAKVTVIQGSAQIPAGTLKIGNLPKVKLPVGEVTKSFIAAAKGVLSDAQTKIAGTSASMPQVTATIASTNTFFDDMTANIAAAVAPKPKGKSSVRAADTYTVALSLTTVQQMDSYYAGLIAAGQLNTTEPQMVLAYKTWEQATQLPPGTSYDAAAALKLAQASLAYQDLVKQNSTELTEAINSMMAPTTATIASLTLVGVSTSNPAVLLLAGQLALCSDVLTASMILGLGLDAAYYAATNNPQKNQVYLNTAANLSGEFLTGQLLGKVGNLALGESAGDLAVSLKDLHGTVVNKGSELQGESQPEVAADTIPPPTVKPSSGFDGLYAGNQTGSLQSGNPPVVTPDNEPLDFVVTKGNIGPGFGAVGSNGAGTFVITTFTFTGTFTATGASGTWTEDDGGGVTGSGSWSCSRTKLP